MTITKIDLSVYLHDPPTTGNGRATLGLLEALQLLRPDPPAEEFVSNGNGKLAIRFSYIFQQHVAFIAAPVVVPQSRNKPSWINL